MRKVIPIRGNDQEHDAWKEAANYEGLAFSPWARRVLSEAADAVIAEHSEEWEQKEQRQRIQRLAFPSTDLDDFRGSDPK